MGITNISWCDYSFNPWIGCTKVSQGCKNCYAETENKKWQWNKDGWGPGVPRKRTSVQNWNKVLLWDKKAQKVGTHPKVFCSSLADVFDAEVPNEWRTDLWELIGKTKNLVWLLLTKRPENVINMVDWTWIADWPKSVWIGTSVEDDHNAMERIPHLWRIPTPNRFLSMEPLLEYVDMNEWLGCPACLQNGRPYEHLHHPTPGINWVIVGGESGPNARVMDQNWAYKIQEVCSINKVPYFFKQTGEVFARQMGYESKHGSDPAEWYPTFRVQEFPEFEVIA